MATGKIIELNNNYGIITTDSYKVKNELIPFKIESRMLIEKEGKTFIKYTEEVNFNLVQDQGIRDRDIKEASDIVFNGEKWKYKERYISDKYSYIVKKRLEEYCFYCPELADEQFDQWLVEKGFQPRMLEYLSQGIFTPKKILKISANNKIDFEAIDAMFKIDLLFAIDRIDIELRKYILSWIVGIENSYKSYFSEISVSENGEKIGAEILSEWASKKPKIKKLIKRARNKRKFRNISNEFDYLIDESTAPISDFMEQLELNELTELIDLFYNAYSKRGEIPNILDRMKECISFISDLCALRNAAAHGRCILPPFMDPDYNGNWDLEFDNVEGRCSVDKWILYNPLCIKWEKLGLEDYSKQIINTLYGNPLRRAWVELHYIYFYIVAEIEKRSFELFKVEALWFLGKDKDIIQQTRSVNLCNLRLSDMGNTTLGISAPPYDEIAEEAFSVWEIFC